jgi:hypothetical protein
VTQFKFANLSVEVHPALSMASCPAGEMSQTGIG